MFKILRRETYEAIANEIALLEEENANLRTKVSVLRGQNEILQRENEDLKKELRELRAENAILKNRVDNLEANMTSTVTKMVNDILKQNNVI